jgi:exonuclease VII large subunit
MHMSDGAAAAVNTVSQDVQAAQREAAQQAQQAQQQAQRELQQAQREVQQAQREAQQAQQEAQREAQQAQREAQQAVRQMQAELARTSAREGQAVPPFPPFPPGGPQIPEGAVVISVAFFVMCAVIAIGVPIVRAITRRMDRRTVAPTVDADTHDRLERIEQAVDAIAVEVERISEGQRFTTKIISELRGLPQPDPSAALAERSGDRSAVPLSRAREAR